ncbi:MAG TPA: DNA replication and repair protein RecF [Chitinophagaceae bacterium]|nr:DNA replication and repair protein RecF [Chitinophagaceae bacterium]
MLVLRHISLYQFKNYFSQSFDFNKRIIGICGKNGRGKTNLLDAIYYLCFTKSYFTRSDQANVYLPAGQAGPASGFRVAGNFELGTEPAEVACVLRETGKKECLLNGRHYERFADHIGRFPCVLIAPDDVQIVTGGSEERRRFLDALLSQMDAEYLKKLMEYNRVLQQRNGLLKSFAEQRRTDQQLLDVLNVQLGRPAAFIFNRRRDFLYDFVPIVRQYYREISGEDYLIDVIYESQLLKQDFKELLEWNQERDIILQRTTAGIHKDDLSLTLEGSPFKAMASQGQRKSMLFALKLAEFESLNRHKGFPPLLLLDDVFEKLDAGRMHNLLEYVCCKNRGQIFLTDTHCERLQSAVAALNQPFEIIQL